MDPRRRCSIAWTVLIVVAVVAALLDHPVLDVLAWFIGLPLMLLTARAARRATDERLRRPALYYVPVGALLALAAGGALLPTVRGASDVSTVFVAYFAPLAWLAYRALVARGPWPALAAAALVQVFAPLFLVVGAVGFMGCRCGPYHPPPWTDDATLLACLGTLLAAMSVAGVAVIAFQPRDSTLPEARACASRAAQLTGNRSARAVS